MKSSNNELTTNCFSEEDIEIIYFSDRDELVMKSSGLDLNSVEPRIFKGKLSGKVWLDDIGHFGISYKPLTKVIKIIKNSELTDEKIEEARQKLLRKLEATII